MKFLHRLILLLVLVGWGAEAFPQKETPVTILEEAFLEEADWLNGMVTLPQGGYLVTGFTTKGTVVPKGMDVNWDLYIARLDERFQVEWEKKLGTTGRDAAFGIVENTLGDYYVVGYSGAPDGDAMDGHGDLDLWAMRMDADGNFKWRKNFGWKADDEAYQLWPSPDGGVYVVGYTTEILNSKDRVAHPWALKISPEGEIGQQWAPRTPGSQRATVVEALPGGDWLIGGYLQRYPSAARWPIGDFDAWVQRMSPEGDTLWRHVFPGDQWNVVLDGNLSPDQEIVLVGFSSRSKMYPDSTDVDGWLLKLDLEGKILVDTSYQIQTGASPNDDVLFTIEPNLEGDEWLMAGSSTSGLGIEDPRPPAQLWIQLTDLQGNTKWNYLESSSRDFRAMQLESLGKGEWLICGTKGKENQTSNYGWISRIQLK